MTLINKLPIKVTSRKVFDKMILDVTIGNRDSISLTVPEAIDLIKKVEEKL